MAIAKPSALKVVEAAHVDIDTALKQLSDADLEQIEEYALIVKNDFLLYTVDSEIENRAGSWVVKHG